MVKVIYEGLAKPDNPIFKQPAYFATPFLLKYLDREKQGKNNVEQDQQQEVKEKTK